MSGVWRARKPPPEGPGTAGVAALEHRTDESRNRAVVAALLPPHVVVAPGSALARRAGRPEQVGPCSHLMRFSCAATARPRSPPGCFRSASSWNPVIRVLYRKLRDQGKLPKTAQVACMRKLLTILNAIVRYNLPWNPSIPLYQLAVTGHAKLRDREH